MKYISQSQINLYRNCPHGYELRYKYKKQPIQFDTSHLEVGKRVHDAADNYYKHCYKGDASEKYILDTTYGILRRDWDVTLPAPLLKKAYDCITNFAKFEANNVSNGVTNKPGTEVKLYYNDLMGIVDYLDLDRVKVIDFKTGAKPGIGYYSRLQAVMYKILIKGKFNVNIKYFEFQFLYPGIPRKVDVNDKKSLEVQEDLMKYKDQIIESWKTSVFPKQPRTPTGCKYCEYRLYCKK